jgi:hypothetical protein
VTAGIEAVPTAPAPRLQGPSKRAAVVVILVSLGILAIGMGGGLVVVSHRMFVATYAVPGTVRVHLRDGTWNLYGLSPAGSGANDTGVNPSVVRVEGPDGPIAVHPVDSWFFPRGSDAYRAVVEFSVPTDGEYSITVEAARPGRVMIAPDLEDVARAILPWAIVVGVAFVAELVGWVLLIVGATRRQRAKRAAWLAAGGPGAPALTAAPALPPPGWHPDPYGTHRYRWWDGHRWTEQISD